MPHRTPSTIYDLPLSLFPSSPLPHPTAPAAVSSTDLRRNPEQAVNNGAGVVASGGGGGGGGGGGIGHGNVSVRVSALPPNAKVPQMEGDLVS